MYTDFTTGTFDTDTYGGFDTYDTATGYAEDPVQASCCCDGGYDTGYASTTWELPPEPPAHSDVPDYEPSAVMPAGQPGGPAPFVQPDPYIEPSYVPQYEAAAVMPAGQPGGPAPFVQAPTPGFDAGTIGGGDPWQITTSNDITFDAGIVGGNPWEISSSDFVPVSDGIVGGNPWEISSSDFRTADGSPMAPSMVIGPPAAGSMADSLSQIYGLAGQNGDVMTQLQVMRISDSMHRSVMTWL